MTTALDPRRRWQRNIGQASGDQPRTPCATGRGFPRFDERARAGGIHRALPRVLTGEVAVPGRGSGSRGLAAPADWASRGIPVPGGWSVGALAGLDTVRTWDL